MDNQIRGVDKTFEAIKPEAVKSQRVCTVDSVWFAMVCFLTECVNPLTPASWGIGRVIHNILANTGIDPQILRPSLPQTCRHLA
jgi:hypothetical protein